MSCTIVSAFLTNINEHRSLDKYIEYGRYLLNTSPNKVIFIEETIHNIYFKDVKYENTHFIFIQLNELYLYEYRDELHNFNVIHSNNSKDTIKYMFVQCNKTEWVRKAIELNHFESEQFIWLDFGIYSVVNNKEDFDTHINNLMYKSYENIRIATGIGFYNENLNFDLLYHYICWEFLGGIFGGNKNALLEFADLMKEETLSIVQNKKLICWEVNIWYMLSLKCRNDLFNKYYADHNTSMIENY